MAGITLADAEAQLAVWIAASTAVAAKQSYTIAGAGGASRTLTLVDAKEIRENVKFWNDMARSLAPAGGIRIFAGVPVD